jgi:hypothetical protein
VFVADIADDFILGLDILRANDASVDIGRRVLRLGKDEVPVREAPTPSELKRARPTENRRNWRPACWQCGRTGHLWRGCPRGPAKEAVDRSNWRRDCATDEKQRLDACVAALERQIEELKAKVAEREAAPERKAEATTEALKEEGSEAECLRRGLGGYQIRMTRQKGCNALTLNLRHVRDKGKQSQCHWITSYSGHLVR